MVKRKLIWSQNAKIRLFEILDFYNDKNRSSIYSKKLYKKITKEISTLKKYPETGVKSNLESIRGLIIDAYIVFYEFNNEHVIIHTIWDSRQNPNNLKIK